MNRKWLVVVIILAVFGILVIVAAWMFNRQHVQEPLPETPASQVTSTTSSTYTPTQASSTIRTKTYTNTEFGFEFQYPSDWILEDDKSYSPFSKLTRMGAPLEKKYLIYYPSPPFVVNIVTPDFADQEFSDLKNSATGTVVGGVSGLKYEYKDEESHITIILPFGQYKMILGATKEYENIFNQIIASFKFLK